MKTLRRVSLPTFTLFVAGAWIIDRSTVWYAKTNAYAPLIAISVSAPPDTTQMEPLQWSAFGCRLDTQRTLKIKYAPKMWANVAVLYKGETLQLHFAPPNAHYLGIVDPKGRFFYLVFPAETAVGELTPLVESKRFVMLQSLEINTGSLKADPYTYGVYTNQPVFTQSGTYIFLLGENLHVDDSGFLDKVTVRYIHTPRPARATPNTAMN